MKLLSYFMMLLVVVGGFAPFASAQFSGPTSPGFTGGSYGSVTNTYQSSRPTFDNFYGGSFDNYWPILNNLQEDQCDAVNSDFIIGIPPGGCSPMVVRSDLLAEQNVPVFCQLSAIRVNPLIDVSTIKSISFKGDYPDEVAGISFHPARAATKSYRTLLGDPIEENIGYVVIVLKRQPDERNLEEYVSGMLTATVRYDAQGAFGTGAAEYYLEPKTDNEWEKNAADSSFWAGKGYLRVTNVDEDEATIEVLTGKDDVHRTVTLKEGETSSRIYYPGQYCTAAMKLRLNKIDNSEDMAKINIDGDIFWVRRGSKLLGGKCVVRDLNVFPGGTGSVEISCSGNSKFLLTMGDSGVVLNNGTDDINDINVGIGGSVKVGSKEIYLGYYGRNNIGEFVILFNTRLTEDDISLITGIFDVESFNNKTEMGASLNRISKFKNRFEIVKEGEKGEEGVKVVSIGLDDSGDVYTESSGMLKYLNLSERTVIDLVDEFPAEKKENGEYFGEEALYNQIELAREVNDEDMQVRLIRRFLEEYPGSDSVEYMRDLKLKVERFDNSGSSANVFVNNDNYNIRVDGFASGSGASDSVSVRIGGGVAYDGLKRGRIYDVDNGFKEIVDVAKQKSTVPRLTIVDIDGSSAKLNYVWMDVDRKRQVSETVEIQIGDYMNVGGVQLSVTDTKVREVAYVSLLPEVRNTKTEANFTFNIGIEKRAIELSPEKAQKKIDALTKSIAEWEEKIDKLGEFIKGMKGACFAISTVLNLKSLITGFSGGALARGKVMEAYEAKCKKDHPELDVHECLSTYDSEWGIEQSVKDYTAGINYVNDKVGCAENATTVKSSFLETKVVDSEAYVNKLRGCSGISESWKYKIGDTNISRADLSDASDFQAVMLKEELCGKNPSSEACKIATEEMNYTLSDNVDRVNVGALLKENENVMNVSVPVAVNPDRKSVVQQAISAKGSKAEGVNETNYLAQVYDPKNANDRYYVELDKNSRIVNVYDMSGGIMKDNESLKGSIAGKYAFVIPSEKDSSCSNVIVKPYVKYYERGNKQGFAAVVPVDKRDGWYAYVENDDYRESGEATAFWLCNVGRDGLMGDGPTSGDVCQYFQASSVGMVSEFIPCRGLGSSAVSRLYQKASTQIKNANRNGNGVDLDGTFVHKTTPLGPESLGVECTDFMSVSDCNLMFNVCDPVICPTSRCDLGGTWKVSNVVSSGIIGSIALCLPNFGSPSKGGVLIPVCLSGIHAGLDSYVSILKSYKSCLEENVESGRYTGICDEITAIYTCEFFWGQLSPILDVLMVRLVERMYGGFQTKGGAEYLTVQAAFDNMDNSINYFANNYAESSFRAFNLKNTEEIGSTVCKGFVGSSVPTSGDMIDSLLEPESPSQFYAYFSETVFSEATVPSTSHYKVYYHIYAGNDRGAQYRVYLKSPPESSYYASRQTLLVKSGYAAKGVAADESIDFTAPTGYKELCVSINGKDECGFGSVTSDFGLNYASQAYVNDQADDRQISSTEDCVTTSTSAWAMAGPNLQAGAEKALGDDDIVTSGIVRICASTNPDEGVVGGNDVYCKPSENTIGSNNSRCEYSCEKVAGETASDVGVCRNANGNKQKSQGKWIDVGHCDNKEVRCWLDSTTVEKNLGQYMAVNNLTVNDLVRDSEDLRELDEQYKNVAEKMGVLRGKVAEIVADDIGKLIVGGVLVSKVSDVISELDGVAGVEEGYVGQGSNAAKAEALALKATIYAALADKLKGVDVKTEVVKVVGGNPFFEGLEKELGSVALFDVKVGDVLEKDGTNYDVVSSDLRDDGVQVIELLVVTSFVGDDKTIAESAISYLSDYGYERVSVGGLVSEESEEVGSFNCGLGQAYELKWRAGKIYLKYGIDGNGVMVDGWRFSFDGDVYREIPERDIIITDEVKLSDFNSLGLESGCDKIKGVGLVEE